MARLADRNVRLTKGEIHWPRTFMYRSMGGGYVQTRRPVCGSKARFEFRYTNKRENVTCGHCGPIVRGWNQ